MVPKRFVVIFVSRRNTLRSILAQACLSHLGSDRFAAYSCGHPAHLGHSIDPAAVSALASARMPLPSLAPRGWGELTRSGSPQANFVITLDAEMLPLQPSWPGQPDAALWAFPDIAAMSRPAAPKANPEAPLREGSPMSHPDDAAHAALQMLYALRRRLELLMSLPLNAADREAIRSDVRDLAYMQ
ncbi:Protein-tyrosine-phosphatase [Variovorax sp. HW608]|uniref:arsenate-mycothiol transferase ArsC n=1 Tax=Variovorax sp. HW608 TaxID=1034889 RepID=UPI00081F90A6|nr:protein tyrosine phosphatase [Variovorax sp. HW608]SCK21013.1 Protein-tyrosine-phosphatase [Variovorax sp. HW608]